MSNVLFLSSKWVDEQTTVSASSVQGLLSAENVQTMRPDQVWRATGAAAEYLLLVHDSDIPMEAAILVATNFGTGCQLRLRRSNNLANLTVAPEVDTGLVSAWPASGKPTEDDWPAYFSIIFTNDQDSYRYTRIDIIDPSNPDGYVEVGRLFAGPAFVPADNIDVNWSFGLDSPDEVIKSPFGQTFTDNRGPASRLFTIPISAMNEDELMDELYELERYCGRAKDFAFCIDPAETSKFHKWSMQCRFDPLSPKQAQPYFDQDGQKVWQTILLLVEVL